MNYLLILTAVLAEFCSGPGNLLWRRIRDGKRCFVSLPVDFIFFKFSPQGRGKPSLVLKWSQRGVQWCRQQGCLGGGQLPARCASNTPAGGWALTELRCWKVRTGSSCWEQVSPKPKEKRRNLGVGDTGFRAFGCYLRKLKLKPWTRSQMEMRFIVMCSLKAGTVLFLFA